LRTNVKQSQYFVIANECEAISKVKDHIMSLRAAYSVIAGKAKQSQ